MNASWIIPFIIFGGALQSAGAAMNGQLKQSLVNPFLASAVSFALITFLFTALFLVMPHPLPRAADLMGMPWWAPLGGLVGAVQVYAGLTQVNKVGAGPFMAITVSAALVASIVIDHYGWFRMAPIHLRGCEAWERRCSSRASSLYRSSDRRHVKERSTQGEQVASPDSNAAEEAA